MRNNRKGLYFLGIIVLAFIFLSGKYHLISHAAPSDSYAEDPCLELTSHETYDYDPGHKQIVAYMREEYRWVNKSYGEKEREESCHAQFDEQNRLLYALGYSQNILDHKSSYCEERIYERDDTEHTCRYLYYKSNSMPYEDGYYVAYRYLFEVSDFQFDEEGRLQSGISYRRNVGSDPNGYSEELFFSRGYRAEYEGENLIAELRYVDFWGTNEVGAWEYRVYQYNDQGDCVLAVVTTEDAITLYHYTYHEDAKKMEVDTYLVKKDWTLSCEDGSTYTFAPQYASLAVKKVAADGSIEVELFYGKAMDLGQQHYLTPEEVEETLDDHMYTVEPGDCLWNIADRCYGRGAYADLLYHVNRSVIGQEKDLVMPGMRLSVPEVGNAQDTKIRKGL